MWIFTKYGYLSIVEHKDMDNYFQIRSREIRPLQKYWPKYDIDIIEWADYRFRITIKKNIALKKLIKIIEEINYINFKNQCSDSREYHDALADIWSRMYFFQSEMISKSQER